MRTSVDSFRVATPGRFPTLLWPLVLIYFVTIVDALPLRREESSPIPRESRVTLGPDGFVTSRGAGRRRSDGLSITRSHIDATNSILDAIIDDQAIKFTPVRVDLGRVETCCPHTQDVRVENRGRVSVRLDEADFSHEGFSLANDIRGIRLDPGDRFNVQFVYVPSREDAQGVDARLRISTTSGIFSLPIFSPEIVRNRYGVSAIRAPISHGVRYTKSLEFTNPTDSTIRLTEMYTLDNFISLELSDGNVWIRPRWPREGDEEETPEVPGNYDAERDYKRRSHRGCWDMPPGSTNPLVKVSLPKNTLVGVYKTFIHVFAGNERLLVVPVHITVYTPGIHVIPDKLDLGMLLDFPDENEEHKVSLDLYNAGVNYIDVLELLVLESNLIVSAQLWGESSVIPPQSEVKDALTVRIRVDTKTTGSCLGSVMLRTNASDDELGLQILLVYGHVTHGGVVYQLDKTQFGVVMPIENVFRAVDDAEAIESGKDRVVEDSEMAVTKLVSKIDQDESTAVMAGTSAIRKLRLWNLFDSPVEMQHVWVEPMSPGQDEVSVYSYTQGEVPIGSPWPEVVLEITPVLQIVKDRSVVRSYFIMVETNVSRHRIQLSVYHGFLLANSTRGLQQYSNSGYSSDSDSSDVSQSCLKVPKGGLVTRALPRIDGGDGAIGTQAVQICRSLVFDLGKVVSRHARTEVVTLTNENPVSITLTVSSISTGGNFEVNIRATVSRVDPSATASGTLPYWYNEFDDNSTQDNTTVVAGDRFELQPGFQVEFYVNVLTNERIGELIASVMTVETPMEAFHFYARLRSIQGTVKPVSSVIVLPAMLPVHSKDIQIQYRNTLKHLVTPLKATISSSNWKVLTMKNLMAPNHVENVLNVRFSPTENARCLDALFLADCFIPMPDSVYEQTFQQLSNYEEFVTHHDLKALKHRNARWGRMRDSKVHMTVETLVHLQTDIVEDVAEVTIKAVLERPLVTALASASLQKDRNTSNVIEFEMTELHERRQMYVNVRNPSNFSVRMELAVAETDRHLFYSCKSDTEVTENENTDDVLGHISLSCLAEWKKKIDDAVAFEWISHDTSNIAPFYFRKRTVLVPAGKEAQLGPIYYYPSKVEDVATTVYVRNRLSHIEAVPILAHSGKGSLVISVDTMAGLGEPIFEPTERSGHSDDDDDMAKLDALFGNQGHLSFDLSEDDAQTDYAQSADILLSNTGAVGLAIRSVDVDDLDDFSKMLSSEPAETPSPTKDFVVSMEDLTLQLSEDDRIILPADTTARFRVTFRPSCFASNVKSWLIVISSDSIKLIRLQGKIATGAAFSCLRSRTSLLWQIGCYWVWIVTTAVTVVTALYVTLSIAYDVEAVQQIQILKSGAAASVKTSPIRDQSEDRDVQEKRSTPSTFEATNGRSEKIQQADFAPSVQVKTRANLKLLEQRQTELKSSDQTCMPSGADLGDEDEKPAAPLVMKAKTSENKDTLPSPVADKAPQSLAVTKASVRDVQEVTVEKAEHEDKSQCKSASRTLMEVLKDGDRDKTDAEGSDSDEEIRESSDEASSDSEIESFEALRKSAPSSPSRVIHPEESRLDAVLAQWSLHSRGNQQKPDKAPLPPPIDTSLIEKPEEPFKAFESISARWRSKDWQQNLSKQSPSDTFLDWNNSLSFNTLGSNLLDSTVDATQRVADDRLKGRRESSSGLGAGPRLYGDDFAAFARAGSMSTGTTPNAASRKAPPGFTPADAKPLKMQAAAGWLRNSCDPAPSVPAVKSSFDNHSVFASKLPLFGPPLHSTSDDYATLGNVGRIGSGRSKVLRGFDTSTNE